MQCSIAWIQGGTFILTASRPTIQIKTKTVGLIARPMSEKWNRLEHRCHDFYSVIHSPPAVSRETSEGEELVFALSKPPKEK